MKPSAVYRMMHANCRLFCDHECPEMNDDRCCVRQACQKVFEEECSSEIRKLFRPDQAIPFLGEQGCLVPPEERTHCTTFVCDAFSASKYHKRQRRLMAMLPIRMRMLFCESLRTAKLIAAAYDAKVHGLRRATNQ